MTNEPDEQRVPVIEERVRVNKRTVQTGLVKVSTAVNERIEHLQEELLSETVDVQRVVIDREVSAPPEIRQEGEVLIIPVVEERAVVVKRWVLKEEIHLRKRRQSNTADIPVTLRSTSVSIEREGGGDQDSVP
jgi:uncharacterized protein (TIGR02271 family)